MREYVSTCYYEVMLKNSYKQNGSAHLIIIIVVVLLLLGALGFVFWKNLNNKNVNSTTKSDSSKQVTTSTKTSESATPAKATAAATDVKNTISSSDGFGVRYTVPSTWTGGKYGGGDSLSESESTTLTAPDGFVITLSVSRLVRGWTYDSPAATILDVQKATGTDLKWVIVDHENGQDGPIRLQIVNSQITPSVGEKKVAGSSIYKLGDADGSAVYLEVYGGYPSDMTLADFNDKEATKQAKAVFESIKLGL